ncbi:HAMP domain-containing sensor histidine kinase [Streptomyces sp. T-3]|nr:HAMP domain-containing sensor histidine kinase [Streptomyces sp. T-3]
MIATMDASMLAAAAAHQLRGPLASVRLRLQLLQDHSTDPAEVLGILGEVDRLSRLIDQILAWGNGRHAEPEPVAVHDTAAARLGAWSAAAADRRVHLSLTGTAATAKHVHGALGHVLDIVLDNALKAAPPGTAVETIVRTAPGEVHVEVTDHGPGMDEGQLAHAREPFWRGPAAGGQNGAGLGLAIAAGLLEASGGRLELARAGHGGLCVTLALPAAAGRQPPRPGPVRL